MLDMGEAPIGIWTFHIKFSSNTNETLTCMEYLDSMLNRYLSKIKYLTRLGGIFPWLITLCQALLRQIQSQTDNNEARIAQLVKV